MNVSLLEHLRSLDPSYGSQQHQRDFLVRMEILQTATPCTKDHEVDNCETCVKAGGKRYPTHHTHCYPQCKKCSRCIALGCMHHARDEALHRRAREVVEAMLAASPPAAPREIPPPNQESPAP